MFALTFWILFLQYVRHFIKWQFLNSVGCVLMFSINRTFSLNCTICAILWPTTFCVGQCILWTTLVIVTSKTRATLRPNCWKTSCASCSIHVMNGPHATLCNLIVYFCSLCSSSDCWIENWKTSPKQHNLKSYQCGFITLSLVSMKIFFLIAFCIKYLFCLCA